MQRNIAEAHDARAAAAIVVAPTERHIKASSLASHESSEVSKLLFTPHAHVDPDDMDIVHTYPLQTSGGASKLSLAITNVLSTCARTRL